MGPEKMFKNVVLELVVILRELIFQRREIALNGVHRLDYGRAEVRAFGESEQFVVARFRRKLERATLEEIDFDERPLRHRASVKGA
jgi:hypothetical protein